MRHARTGGYFYLAEEVARHGELPWRTAPPGVGVPEGLGRGERLAGITVARWLVRFRVRRTRGIRPVPRTPSSDPLAALVRTAQRLDYGAGRAGEAPGGRSQALVPRHWPASSVGGGREGA
ncbi:hypothetical protein GCM10020295_08190 [Streptomyces cinereospinus]